MGFFRALDEVIDVIGDESVRLGLPLLLNGEEGKAPKSEIAGPSILKRLYAAVEDESYFR